MEAEIPLRAEGLTISFGRHSLSLTQLLRSKRGLPAKPTAISARAVGILRL